MRFASSFVPASFHFRFVFVVCARVSVKSFVPQPYCPTPSARRLPNPTRPAFTEGFFDFFSTLSAPSSRGCCCSSASTSTPAATAAWSSRFHGVLERMQKIFAHIHLFGRFRCVSRSSTALRVPARISIIFRAKRMLGVLLAAVPSSFSPCA